MTRAKREKGFRRGSLYYHISDGFHFHLNRRFPHGRISLRCSKFYLRKCLGRAIMDHDRRNFEHRGVHNHGPDRHFVSVRNLRECILRRCRENDSSSLTEIVQEEGVGLHRRVRARVMPNRIRSSATRAYLANRPKIPANLSSLAAALRDPQYRHICTTADGEDFLYAGSCGKAEEQTRSVIFMSRRLKRLMRIVTKVHSDGTWKCRPSSPGSSQLFSIVTIIDHQVIPLVVVLMESRTQRSYEVLFTKIRLLCPEFTPIHIVCDFELAEMNAWLVIYGCPDLVMQGCYFHYTEDVLLHAKKELGMTDVIRGDANVERYVRCCCAIPLLPKDLLQAGLGALVLKSVQDGCFEEIALLLDYIRREWITKRGDVLSVYDCEDRTNNCCESFNAQFNGLVGRKRPRIWRFLKCLKQLEDMCYQVLYSMCHGETVRRMRKPSAIANDENIRNLNQRLEGGLLDVFTFLRLASRRIQGVFEDVFPPLVAVVQQ